MTKELGMETHPGEGVMKEEFPNSRKPSHWQICGEFWNLKEQHNWVEKEKNPQNRCLTTTPSREVAQMLASAIGGWTGSKGCMLRVRTRPECPDENLRELT